MCKTKKVTPVGECIKWLNSEEGKRAMRKSIQEAERITEEFSRSLECDPEQLEKHMTI